jgi:epoxyqueuosine reductase QueG
MTVIFKGFFYPYRPVKGSACAFCSLWRKMDKHFLSENIITLAQSSGIDAVGFADASEFSGYALTRHRRKDPKLTLPQASSIIVAGIYIGGVTMPEWSNARYGRTSRLYLSGFFLDVVKPMIPLADFLISKGYQTRICDGAIEGGSILPLKLAAIRAGLGWQGKHSLLISKTYGTFLALGGLITDAELAHNTREEPDRCRSCTACQDACPLGALDRPYVLNVDRCMSNRLADEMLPLNVQAVMENRIGDCEICQDACPWNKKHIEHPLMTQLTDKLQDTIDAWGDTFYLTNLNALSESNYMDRFGHLNTGIPYRLFRRNISVAMQNAERVSQQEQDPGDS